LGVLIVDRRQSGGLRVPDGTDIGAPDLGQPGIVDRRQLQLFRVDRGVAKYGEGPFGQQDECVVARVDPEQIVEIGARTIGRSSRGHIGQSVLPIIAINRTMDFQSHRITSVEKLGLTGIQIVHHHPIGFISV